MAVSIYVDDEHDDPDTQRIQSFLNKNGMRCDLKVPTHDFAKIANLRAEMFLLDYNLASYKPNNRHIGYHGNSLATEIRNLNPTIPVILVSRKQIIDSPNLHLIGDRSGVDLVLFKGDILSDEDMALKDILGLRAAYRQLAKLQGEEPPKWLDVLTTLGARANETSRIRESFPPIDKNHRCYIPATIRWIRSVLIGYPGILYDSLHASARLGMTENAFLSEQMQAFFADAAYTGPFSDSNKRWWVDRLVTIATQTIIDADVEGPMSLSFRDAYKQVTAQLQLQLEPSRCLVDDKPGADQICYILGRPVKRENSIIYYPDSRPHVMDAARVSTEAIENEDSFDESLVETSSIGIVNEIWNRSRS